MVERKMVKWSGVLTVAVLSGCASTQETTPLPKRDTSRVESRIETLAMNVSDMSTELVDIQRAKFENESGNPYQGHDISLLPKLKQFLPLGRDFKGTLREFVIMLSDRAKMQPPVFFGRPPPNGVLVFMKIEHMSVYELLNQAGARADYYADVTYKGRDDYIQVNYKDPR